MSPNDRFLSEPKDFYVWSERMRFKLMKLGYYEYVFDCDWKPAVVLPVQGAEESTEDFYSRGGEMLRKDHSARIQILARVSTGVKNVCYNEGMSAKQLYNRIKEMYEPRYSIHVTTRALQKIRLSKNDLSQYCRDFDGALARHAHAVEQYAREHDCDKAQIEMPPFYINVLFQQGTNHVPWLQNWRSSRRPHIDTLDDMVTSLRHETPPWELP